MAAGLALGILLLVPGCSQAPASRSIIMAAPPKDTASQEADTAGATPDPAVADEAMTLATVTTALSGAYAGSEDGCYTLATYKDGSADLLYFNYTDATMTLLETSEKTEESPQGHLRGFPAGATPVAHQDKLYLFRLGGGAALSAEHGEDGQAAIFQKGLDGSDQGSALLPVGWSFILSSAVLCDDTYLYFLAQDEATGGAVLAKVPTDMAALGSGVEELHRYDVGSDYSIEGYWEKGPLIMEASALPPFDDPEFNVYWENREYRLLGQGMNTGQTTELKSWKQGVPTSVQGNILYYWNADDTSLYALNADTGEDLLIAGGFAPKDYVQAQLMRTTLDGKLRVQFSTNRNTRDYSVEPATGVVQETPVEKLGENVAVCAESSKGILVRSGEHWVASAKVPDFVAGAKPSPTNPEWVSMPTYALIDAQSYWTGSRKFTEINDMVYD